MVVETMRRVDKLDQKLKDICSDAHIYCEVERGGLSDQQNDEGNAR